MAELLEEQKRFQKLIGNMGKAGLMSKGGELTNMMRNPKQVRRFCRGAEVPSKDTNE